MLGVNVFYKHSRIKQYLKDGRAMRVEQRGRVPPAGVGALFRFSSGLCGWIVTGSGGM